ncbi:MAG: serine hydrolase domain-containing protein [Acidimicrobiia bacterium]
MIKTRLKTAASLLALATFVATGCTESPAPEIDLSGLQAIADAAGGIVAVGDADGTLHLAAGTTSSGETLGTEDGFMLWSATKMVTAISVLTMVDDGLVSLDEPVEQYVDFPVHSDLTLRHLLQHKSGIPDVGPHSCGTAEVAEFIKDQAANPATQPGTSASYSTPGFNLVGLVIESATGMQAHEYQRKVIFEPLGMTSTYYAEIEDGPPLFHSVDRCGGPQHVIGTGGGLASTAKDMDLLRRSAFAGELLTDDSRDHFTTYESEVFGFPYALGNATVSSPDGRTVLGHWGTAGYEAGAFYEPSTGRTIVVLKTHGLFEDTLWAALDWFESELTQE